MRFLLLFPVALLLVAAPAQAEEAVKPPASARGYPYFSKTAEGYPYLPKTAEKYPYLPKTADGYPYLPKSDLGYPYLYNMAEGYPLFSKTAEGYPYLPKSADGYPYLPKTPNDPDREELVVIQALEEQNKILEDKLKATLENASKLRESQGKNNCRKTRPANVLKSN